MSWTADPSARQSTRIEPGSAWTVVTDAPLKCMAMAREARRVLACDEGGQVYLIDLDGQFLSIARAPGVVQHAAFSDDGALIALVGEGSRLWLLDADLGLIADREVVTDPSALAVDPLGNFVAVASKMNLVQFYNKHGKMAGRFETRQHLSHLAFVATEPALVGVGAFGSINLYDLRPAGSGKLAGDLAWTEQLMSGVGRLAVTGDGSMILLGCFTHGVQRFDLQGRNEGAYHLGGSAALAVPDFAGRNFACATLEGELAILGGNGNVRWRTQLARPATALEVDALGRFLVHGSASGEITRLDFHGGPRADAAPSAPSVVSRPGTGTVRKPDWTVEVVASVDQAEFAVLAVIDEPGRVGVITHKNKLELYTQAGKKLGQAPEILGVGRILRTAPGWIAAATDRQVVVCDLDKNTGQRIDVSLVEVTHLAIQPDTYGLAIVQERDRIGRATMSGRWIWKAELNTPVEEIAIGPDGHTGFTLEDGRLRVRDAAGNPAGEYRSDPPEPLFLAAAPADSPRGVTWITLARKNGVLRGHRLDGAVVWESPVPWDGWGFHAIGPLVVVSAADGRAIAFDGSGHARGQGAKTDGPRDVYYADGRGRAVRVSKQGPHLICSTLDGQVAWRAVVEGALGPVAAGRSGVAVMIGRSLAWFDTADAARG